MEEGDRDHHGQSVPGALFVAGEAGQVEGLSPLLLGVGEAARWAQRAQRAQWARLAQLARSSAYRHGR